MTWKTMFVAGGLALGSLSPLGSLGIGLAGAQEPLASQRVTLHIEGMDCPACTAAIRIAIKKLAGVKEAKVNYAEKQAVVEYAPSQVTPQQLVEAVNRLGYHATLPAQGS